MPYYFKKYPCLESAVTGPFEQLKSSNHEMQFRFALRQRACHEFTSFLNFILFANQLSLTGMIQFLLNSSIV
jgi:hypothetical protein